MLKKLDAKDMPKYYGKIKNVYNYLIYGALLCYVPVVGDQILPDRVYGGSGICISACGYLHTAGENADFDYSLHESVSSGEGIFYCKFDQCSGYLGV